MSDGTETDQRLVMCAQNLREGMRLGPIFYVVAPEQVQKFAESLGTDNPLYRGPSALVPPTLRLNDYALLIAKHFRGGKGGVHAKHWFEFHQPMHVGQAVRVEGVVTSAAVKRDKFYFTLEYESRDATTDALLVRQAITSVLLNPNGEMS
ncbi:MAG TPA: MaoC family dehydratase N-terminal domain-containing protein [Candidatus Binataceae bacterium]|nr:MaoC family dehydratase N-terminal domain-containing protein [Candidatus Binataceae bacterium]